MNAAILQNILVFMKMAAESGSVKNVNDVLAFGETYQAVVLALNEATTVKPVVTP